MSLLKYLLDILARLHEGNYAQVRWGSRGELTEKIPINRGVRQGCTHDAPKLGGTSVTSLLFADDTLAIPDPNGTSKPSE